MEISQQYARGCFFWNKKKKVQLGFSWFRRGIDLSPTRHWPRYSIDPRFSRLSNDQTTETTRSGSSALPLPATRDIYTTARAVTGFALNLNTQI
jgi:hypothetical protein